jgi:hypothetical protein
MAMAEVNAPPVAKSATWANPASATRPPRIAARSALAQGQI